MHASNAQPLKKKSQAQITVSKQPTANYTGNDEAKLKVIYNYILRAVATRKHTQGDVDTACW